MTTIPLRLFTLLTDAATRLRAAGAEVAADGLEALARQAQDNCTVAVVGRVKAGKSSFINALLGGELAAVGETETTATINHFRNGIPDDPEKPVLCYWRGGKNEPVSRAFLDSLQGNDIETLRRADGIDHLEYRLQDHPLLKGITLVDTPGIGAVVEEHENRTAEFMGLFKALRARHHGESERLSPPPTPSSTCSTPTRARPTGTPSKASAISAPPTRSASWPGSSSIPRR